MSTTCWVGSCLLLPADNGVPALTDPLINHLNTTSVPEGSIIFGKFPCIHFHLSVSWCSHYTLHTQQSQLTTTK